MIERTNDHLLLLQLERANEALDDRVTSLEEGDDEDFYEKSIMRHDEQLDKLGVALYEVSALLTELTERVVQLEHERSMLIDVFKRAYT